MKLNFSQRYIDPQASNQPGAGGGPGGRHRAHQLTEKAQIRQLA